MELKGIKEFLEKYKKTLFQVDHEREEIRNCVQIITGVRLENSEFKIERSVFSLHTTPIKKNQIFLFKKTILDELKKKNINSVFDIN